MVSKVAVQEQIISHKSLAHYDITHHCDITEAMVDAHSYKRFMQTFQFVD